MASKKTKKNTKPAQDISKRPSGKLLLIVSVCIIATALFGLKNLQKNTGPLEFQKGVVYVSWAKNGYNTDSSDESLVRVKEIGSNWIALLVTWYQTNCWSGDIHRTEETPSDESLIRAIRKAHGLGLKVMLKPHLDLLDKTDGSWRGEIGCVKEGEWDKWFKDYGEYILYYADMAQREKVEMICIGTELSATATTKGYLWEDLIKKVRKRYSGKLTYAAHWDRYQDIRFWHLLDYAGINAYFPLTEKLAPTYEELLEGWGKWYPDVEAFQKSVGKPVIFLEIGCSSADGAAIRPWEHVPRSEVNNKLQEDYYKSLIATFGDKEWFYGLYWWYWGTSIHMGGEFSRSFTPQNKPAEKVVIDWFAKRS